MPPPQDPSFAIIFNIWNPRSPKPALAPTPACALIRHAFNCYYYELVTVATNKTKVFHAEHVFAKTMRSYRNAVMAYARGEQIALLRNDYSGKKPFALHPYAVKRVAPLVSIDRHTGYFEITNELRQAVDKAETLSANLRSRQWNNS
jgi:hypothetical protein